MLHLQTRPIPFQAGHKFHEIATAHSDHETESKYGGEVLRPSSATPSGIKLVTSWKLKPKDKLAHVRAVSLFLSFSLCLASTQRDVHTCTHTGTGARAHQHTHTYTHTRERERETEKEKDRDKDRGSINWRIGRGFWKEVGWHLKNMASFRPGCWFRGWRSGSRTCQLI